MSPIESVAESNVSIRNLLLAQLVQLPSYGLFWPLISQIG